jgi:hypothetical protein
MTEEVGDLFDRSSLLDHSCGKAVAQKMSATSLNLNAGTLQSRADDARYGTAVGQGTQRWSVQEEHPALSGSRARVQNVLGKCSTGLVEQWHDAVATALGMPQHELSVPPSDVSELDLAQLLVAQPGGRQQQHHGPVTNAGWRCRIDGIDRALDIFPRQMRWQMRLTPARGPRYERR